jgi:hypothetical protein
MKIQYFSERKKLSKFNFPFPEKEVQERQGWNLCQRDLSRRAPSENSAAHDTQRQAEASSMKN